MTAIDEALRDCGDIVRREFRVGGGGRLVMLYADNFVDLEALRESILETVMLDYQNPQPKGILEALLEEAIAISEVKKITTVDEICDAVFWGDTVLLMDGNDFALQATTKQFPNRGISKAETEVVVQGPKDAFMEVMAFNIVLTRRRIRDPKLKLKRKKAGQRTKTDIAVMYMEDLVRPEVLAQVEKQLDQMEIAGLLDSGSMEQLLERRKVSPFPQLQMTERPDKTASALLEGRVVLLADNTPYAILLPATLNTFFQAAEDYYERWEIMSFIRMIRYAAAFFAVTLPGLYILLRLTLPRDEVYT